jgi:hypothetical protein
MTARVTFHRTARRLRRRSVAGKTVDEFCTDHDVSPATFYRWKKQKIAPPVWQPGGRGGRQLILPEDEAAWKARRSALLPAE